MVRKTARLLAQKLNSNGWSYGEIADRIGVSKITIKRWVRPEFYQRTLDDNKRRRKTRGYQYGLNWRTSKKGRITSALSIAKSAAKKRGHKRCINTVQELIDTIVDHCQMCGKTQEENGQQLCLDHDHKTGKFRGWLCTACNVSLGHYDNIKKLAERYLRKQVT